MLHDNLSIGNNGHLYIAGVDTVKLAEKYGTPLYVVDEGYIKNSFLKYINITKKYFGKTALPLFASKSLSYVDIYRLAKSAGMGIDVVSGGELYTAKCADFPMENVYFHGNNKPDKEIETAFDYKIGCFVVDNHEELETINRIALERGVKQKILLRISPGIDPHTHSKVSTGRVDSKFGTAIATGQALELVKRAIAFEGIDFYGLHCHVGSQIFDYSPFKDAAEIMIKFIAEIKAATGVVVRELNLGGGFGVRYVESDPQFDCERVLSQIAESFNAACEKNNVARPDIRFEPGRSIVAAAGLTLYTVGSFKEITGYKKYVSIDGGMPDNPRYALYQSSYTAVVANKADRPADEQVTIAGRCCESGDLIQEGISLQKCEKGDILAVLVTGAYNYSMASNYNRIPRPAMVSVCEGKDRLVVRRESYEDLVRNDL